MLAGAPSFFPRMKKKAKINKSAIDMRANKNYYEKRAKKSSSHLQNIKHRKFPLILDVGKLLEKNKYKIVYFGMLK